MTDKIEAPIAKAQMLIHKPVRQVFEALVDPAITSRFWFSKGSRRLATGKKIRPRELFATARRTANELR